MGDRSNVVVKDGQSQVWLYGHWNGESYVNDTQAALARRVRWNDPSYLARIIFDQLTDGQHGEETGFGISTSIGDNNRPILVVDVRRQIIYLLPKRTLTPDGIVPNDYEPSERWTFEEFAVATL